MEGWLLNENFITLKIIDIFESFIWTERYNQAGDFEIYTPVDMSLLQIISAKPKNVDYYIWSNDSTQQMIVETVKLEADAETGFYMTLSGRSLESMLDRRIIWNQTVLNGNLQNGIEKLLNENVINPKILDRKISDFVFEKSNDPAITELKIQAQYTGNNLYDTIVSICEAVDLGFCVTLNEKNQFVFKLYFGEDRSYLQIKNPYVIFSPKFENLINSNYLKSFKSLKNVVLVAGEDSGTERRTRSVGSEVGLARKELYVDARDIQSETEEGILSDEVYNAQLEQRGAEKLSDYTKTEAFEGEIESAQNFIYGTDYFIGDICQMVNEFGIEARVRITEFVRSQDTAGYETYPTFVVTDFYNGSEYETRSIEDSNSDPILDSDGDRLQGRIPFVIP